MIVLSLSVLFPFFAAIFGLLVNRFRSFILPVGLLPPLIFVLTDGGQFFDGVVFHLDGPLGVALLPDQTARLMVILSALVGLGIWIWVHRRRSVTSPFYPLALLLIGACNAVFLSFDLFNIYVCIELVTVLGFLLIRFDGGPRQIWAAVKYLLLGNLGMVLFLLAVLDVYAVTGELALSAVVFVPLPVVMLLVAGLAVKGGIFVFGLWLPEAHGGASPPVSALLSGVVVLTGVIPILRLVSVRPDLLPVMQVTGVLSVLLGIVLALRESDVKRLLACSTLSQLGYVILVPSAGPYFVLGHGLVKAWLFLAAGELPDKRIYRLRSGQMHLSDWLGFGLPCLILAGIPGSALWAAKGLAFGQSGPIVDWFVKGSSTLTAFYLFRPLAGGGMPGHIGARMRPLAGPIFFLIALAATTFFVPSPVLPLGMPFVTIVAGAGAARWFSFWSVRPRFPAWERLDHLMGSVIAVALILYLIGGILS